MKTFVTLFERSNNEILLKDVGMIPFFINQHEEFQASVATCRMSGEYSYIDKYLNGFKVEFIPYKFKDEWLNGVYYLIKNATKIDILNLYHLKIKTFVDYLVYKVINRRGKVYLKLDIDCRAIQKKDGLIRTLIYKYFLKHVDYCSAESNYIIDKVEEKYGIRVKYISNGFYNFECAGKVEKDNIFLTVGRLGTEQKGTELLLDAFAESASKHDWKLILVGSIEEKFNTYIQNYYEKHCDLKTRVIFTGPISSKKELQDYYNKAKVFVLPSKWESFGLVLLEALSAGCYLIGSDKIPALPDMINKGRFGQIVEYGSIKDLSCALEIASKQKYSRNRVVEEISYANNNYRWDRIVYKLAIELIKTMNLEE